MRPRKTILLVDVDEQQLSCNRFLLQVAGWRVVTARDAAAALALHDLGVDLVLGFADGMLREWATLAERMKTRRPEIPLLLVTRLESEGARAALAPAADMVLHRFSNAQLLEMVRVQIARQRGPKKALVPVAAAAAAGD